MDKIVRQKVFFSRGKKYYEIQINIIPLKYLS